MSGILMSTKTKHVKVLKMDKHDVLNIYPCQPILAACQPKQNMYRFTKMDKYDIQNICPCQTILAKLTVTKKQNYVTGMTEMKRKSWMDVLHFHFERLVHSLAEILDHARSQGWPEPSTSGSSKPASTWSFILSIKSSKPSDVSNSTNKENRDSESHTTKTCDLEKARTITPTNFVNVIPL